MTHDQPANSRSMPTNSPMTHKADSGHCRQIRIPRMSVTTPLRKTHHRPWKRSLRAMTMRNSPPTRKPAASMSVKKAAEESGCCTNRKPRTAYRMPAKRCIQKPRQRRAQMALAASTPPAIKSSVPIITTVASVARNVELMATRPTRMSKIPRISSQNQFLRKPSHSALNTSAGSV